MRVSLFSFLMVLLPSLILSKEEGSIDKRIVNGCYAERGDFPYHARIIHETSSGEIIKGGGTVLSFTWIIGAAHCAEDAVRATVHLGMTDETNLTGVLTFYANADGIIMHPLYSASTYDYDVCLYMLNSSIPYSLFFEYPYIGALPLPSSEDNVSTLDNYNGTISGWGATNEAGDNPHTLQWAPAHIMPHAQCVEFTKNSKSDRQITENMICIDKTVVDTGSCYGDSGDPLTVRLDDGMLTVVGVSSWISNGCDSTDPVIYTYLGSTGIKTWINDNIFFRDDIHYYRDSA